MRTNADALAGTHVRTRVQACISNLHLSCCIEVRCRLPRKGEDGANSHVVLVSSLMESKATTGYCFARGERWSQRIENSKGCHVEQTAHLAVLTT
mmetsp:Transcript_66067/g.166577  ORF Transcript_66067/g.166577 Transcript_66067/m.166577 type:complete len:95 (-) Transcript_66067:6-290(-)